MIGIIFGIILIAFGAALSGSFSIPMTKTKGWDWEHSWLAYSLFAYIVFPIVLSFIFAPGFVGVLMKQSAEILLWIFFLGIIYGIANLSFGLSLKYIGLSLGFTISLGLMMVFGIIIPPIVDGRIYELLGNQNGYILLTGLIIAIIGVAISAYSGYLKEKNENVDKSEYNFPKGIIAALIVGITGSAQALGVEQGIGISNELTAAGLIRYSRHFRYF